MILSHSKVFLLWVGVRQVVWSYFVSISCTIPVVVRIPHNHLSYVLFVLFAWIAVPYYACTYG